MAKFTKGSLIFRQPDDLWAAIEAKTKSIVFELPDGTHSHNEQFQKMSIASIVFRNTTKVHFNYFVEDGVDEHHHDVGVDCLW